LSVFRKMNSGEQEELKKQILYEIEVQKHQIESLQKSVEPVVPDNAIGRLTRMEAIGSKAISETALNSARTKLAKLEVALGKVGDPEFGTCRRCSNPIPKDRIMLMPESVVCVACAGIK